MRKPFIRISARPVFRIGAAVLLAFVFITSLAACSTATSGPSLAVSSYLDTVRVMDIQAGNAFLLHPTVEGDLLLSGRESKLPTEDETYLRLFDESITKIWSDMNYKVKASSITGETAVVAVEVTIADMTTLEGMMTSAAFDAMNQVPEVQNRIITEVLVEELQYAAASTASQLITHTIRLDLKNVDGTWKILDHKVLGRTLIGNISALLIPTT
jgi:hypothetical protein